nr:helicase SRCAP isoform X4 [Neomonachus schauinslandi]
MTGSNPVSPASSSSPASSGAGGISPQHIAQDSSLDGPPGPPDSATVPLEGLSLPQAADLANKGPKWEKSHAEIAEQAKHEAEIETRIAELRKEGFWSLKRLPKVPEPPRPKGHWDYLCEEMQWLSADFAQERRWKRGVARKVVRMVIRHHEEQRQKEERARREEQAKLRRIASTMAKDVRQFWSNVEKVVQFKQQSRLEEKRKKALDLHLDFIVGQTEKYSDLLSQSLNQPLASSKAGSSPCLGSSSAASSPPPPVSRLDDEDGDFQPQEEEEEDDEETIEVEEQQEGNDAETQRREIELLRREGELPLEELLRSLPPQLLGGPSSPSRTPSSRDSDTRDGPEEGGEEEPSQVLQVKPPPSVTQRNKQPWHPDEDDEEFTANEDEAEDEEDTIAAEEQLEGEVDHAMELSELAREGELSMEELLQQYAGAYASDASAPGSGSSEEEDEDEVEANSSDCEPEGALEAEEAPQEDSSSQSESAEEQSEEEEDERSEEEETSGSSESEESESDESEESRSQSQAEEEEEEEEDDDFGVEYLLARDEEQSEADGGSGPPTPGPATTLGPKKEISDIAAAAESLQPKGYTLATTQVKTPIPLLLRGQLREYQHIGLDWLVTMYEKKLNGILADEMGLGKTIQTISLLAHLACEKGNWGPHLIIVPTSVMLNWEMELKRWCPSFKILTYYGAQKERKLKRQGWTKPNAFHVCITSYKLVLQDHQAFRRKNWRYLILDEAQNIKNFKSQRWQSLLNFNSQRRLLLTGTPLQNSLMELWSLMHFLMPHVFQSHREFKEWFSNPLTGMIEGSQEYNEGLVKRLHKVLRPFLLRRVKVDVEKQMPKKYEHVIRCRLSKRQRCLYDDFMAQTTTKETLATGHFMSVINILMQLRKVCNHPNLFDPRPVTSPFITPGICFSTASLVLRATDVHPLQRIDMGRFDLIGLEGRVSRYEADTFLPRHRLSRRVLLEVATAPDPPPRPKPVKMKVNRMLQPVPKQEGRTVVVVNSPRTPMGPVPVRPPPGPELSTQPTPGPTPPVLPAPLMVSASPVGPPLVPASRPPGPVLLPPLQPNSGPLPQVLPSPLGVLSGTSRPPTPTLSLKPAPPAPVRLSPAPPPGSSSLLKPLTVPPGYTFPSAATTTSTTTATAPTTAVPASTPAPQRLILSPDMQARLPSGEVVSIGQLASLAQRPVASAGGSKPLTFQIQGNKLTLTGAQVRQLAVGQPRPLQIPAPAQTLSLAPGPPLGPSQTLSLAPAPSLTPASPMGPAPAHTLTLAPVSSSASLLTPASVQTLTLSPAPVPVSTLGPAAAQTLALAPVSTQASASQTSSLMVSASGAAPLPVTMVSRLPVSKDEPETLTLRPGPPSPPSTATSFSGPRPRRQPPPPPRSPFYLDSLEEKRKRQRSERLERIFQLSEAHGALAPVYGTEVLDFCTLPQPVASPIGPRSPGPSHPTFWTYTEAARQAVLFPQQRLDQLSEIIERFIFVMPPVEAPPPSLHACHPPPWLAPRQAAFQEQLACELWPRARPLHRIVCNMRTQFPDLRLIQYDCGKLQTLAVLLRQLKAEGHRVLIFTQMTRMLDVLEQFLTYHGHLYLRLDGSTRVEQRQALMERFNADKRIFCFILSTRSGGVGVNLTGADTVVFYDSDWNPTMDAQAQDRCHRIGQTRDVHIYRLISERTVEENILKKANQKRMLGDMAIEGGNFTTAYFKQQTIRELFDMPLEEPSGSSVPSAPEEEEETVASKQTHILEQALCRAEDEEDIRAATQAKAEQVAELAEFNENDGFPAGEGEEASRPGAEDEEMSRAEQEIAALVEQLTPIERYAMKFLEASLEEVSREELKQAEEQVEAARKDLDQAKEEVFRLPQEEEEGPGAGDEVSCGTGGGSHRRSKKAKAPERPGTRVSERLRGARAETQGANHTPVTSTHHTRSTSTPPRCSPARERVPRPAPRPRPTPASAPAVIPAPIPVPIPAPIPISAPNPVTMLPVHILPSPPLPPSQIPPSCSSACIPPPACTPPPAHTPPPTHTSLSTPSSPLLLGLPSVPISPPVTNLPFGLGPETELCAQALASTESPELADMASSETSPLTLVPPKDLLPLAVEILPISEKNLSLASSAPSPTLEADSVPNGQEQEVPEPAEGTILTVLPDGEEVPSCLSESNGLDLPPSASDELLPEPLEADKSSEELVEAQTPISSPEKTQELVSAEVAAPSTSSSTTSSPESPSPARPPRRRTSADVEIRGQGAGRPGQPPGPKVLRKLPGRLVTVVEEKELVRRRRQQRGTASTLLPGVSETGASPGSPSARSMSGPESSPPTSGPCEAAPPSTLPTPTQQPFIARRRIELGVTGGGSPENGEGALLAITPPAVKRRRGRPPKKNRSPADAGRGVDEVPSSTSKGKTNGADPVPGAETLIVAEPVLGPQLSPGPQPLGPQPIHRPEPIILSPVEKRRRGRPPKARDLPIPGTISSPGDGNLESRTQPLPLPPPLPPLPPLLACPTATVANTVTNLTMSTSPPKRKRGRPPKNPPSPRPSQLPVLDRDSSSVLESCGLGRRRQPQGQGESEGSSSDEDGSRPLTRLARLRLEAEGMRGRKSEGSMVVAVIQDDLDLADSGPGGLELTPPVVSLAPKLRSTRLRPGSLVPPLETEKVPRKRAGAPVGGPGLAKRGRLQPPSPLGPEGSVEESEAEASGEEEEGDGSPRRRPGPRRLGGATNQGDQRILRSSAPPHLAGPTISHRGRKAKT